VIPGLRQVRGPAALYNGVHMALCILAGIGAAGLIRLAGSAGEAGSSQLRRGVVSAVLIACTFVELLRPAALGLEPRVQYVAYPMRPPEQELAFHERIAELGGGGAMLELPFSPRDILQSSRAVLLAAYHQRRTSQCFNSYLPPEVVRVKAISDRLPAESALRQLSAMGFTTILVHPSSDEGDPAMYRDWRRTLEAAPATPMLRLIFDDGERSAWAILAEPAPAAALRPED
jgi:hypothetical protein